jgi:hypothetical protein
MAGQIVADPRIVAAIKRRRAQRRTASASAR